MRHSHWTHAAAAAASRHGWPSQPRRRLALAAAMGWAMSLHRPAAALAPDADWALAPPQAHGISQPQLQRLQAQLPDAQPGLRALLLLRHGQPVLEYYRSGLGPQTLHPVHSVTKSVVSTLVGAAIAQGQLPGVDVPLTELLEEARQPGVAPGVARMRLADLLTQRSGFKRVGDRHGWYAAFAQLAQSRPVVEFAMHREVQTEPGTRFLYSNLDTHLVSVALGRRLGMPLAEHARQRLFTPLGITEWVWPALHGDTAGAGSLMLGARSLARLGQLWLQQGRWQGQQLLDPAYFAQATQALVTELGPEVAAAPPTRMGYGYLFWTAEGLRPGWRSFYAAGKGGQIVLMVPSHQVVIVALTDADDWAPDRSAARTTRLLREQLVPAIADEAQPATAAGASGRTSAGARRSV